MIIAFAISAINPGHIAVRTCVTNISTGGQIVE